MEPEKIIKILVYGGVGSIVILVAVIGNSFIIAYFGFKEKKKTKYNLFILALALSDLTGIVLCSLSTIQFFIYSLEFLCLALLGLAHCFLGISAFLIVGMSYERFRGMTQPINSGKLRKKHVVIYCVFVCVIWAVYGIPLYVPMQDGHPYCYVFITGESRYYFLSLVFVKSIVPSIVMCLFYFKTKASLKKHQQCLHKITILKRNIAVLKILKLLIIFFVIFVFVPSILQPIYGIYISSLLKQELWNNLINALIQGLPGLNNIVNCFVYAGYVKNFRKYLFEVCKKLRRKQHQCDQHQPTNL